MLSNVKLHRLAQHGRHRLAAAAVGHADEIGSGARHEQRGGQVRQAALAGVGIVELAGIGLGVVDNSFTVFHGDDGWTTRI